MGIKAPYLPYERLRQHADGFFAEHHPSRVVPVPIETIVDNRFRIDIVPMPGLLKAFNVDAWISNDFGAIYVDEFVYKQRPRRYRFSLAHELSHLLLHADIFAQLSFGSLEEWRQVLSLIPPTEYGWLEWQAYSLAGLILVPTEQLTAAFERMANDAFSAGVDIHDCDDDARKLFDSHLAIQFDVSRDVVSKRLKYEHLRD